MSEPTEYELLQSGASEIARKVLRGDHKTLDAHETQTICKAWAWLAKEEITATQDRDSLRAKLARYEEALREIAEMAGKTLLGDGRYDEGANSAFEQCAGTARRALGEK